ncbi:hypothetical protein BCR34DRAFT_591430 [Clohesyomyces aquaticus]|uniref:Uncharacterized protein n=1 Tax=Clohesyomyces aquaticus TaxID=1231657 RepID=A0A1Y1Z0N0_9PLEO|nr:hypothetical protein BCR34DRAFT_591430 [Clohesyomyces aquaticus]
MGDGAIWWCGGMRLLSLLFLRFLERLATGKTECVFTIEANSLRTKQALDVAVRPRFQRFTSAPMLRRAFGRSQAAVHSISPANLQHAGPQNPQIPQDTESTEPGLPLLLMRRTILCLEKPGKNPLIETYRTDAKAWQPFLEAVVRGKAKIMLWCEPNLHFGAAAMAFPVLSSILERNGSTRIPVFAVFLIQAVAKLLRKSVVGPLKIFYIFLGAHIQAIATLVQRAGHGWSSSCLSEHLLFRGGNTVGLSKRFLCLVL